MTSSPLRASLLSAALALAACAGPAIPDPQEAVQAYADAAARGDADAIHAMLSAESSRALSPDDVRRLVADERPELAEQASALRKPGVAVKARARVRFADGETASLDVEDGAFRVSSAGALPAGARTPEDALGELRRVLARRSYAGLIRVLTPATRSAIEADLRSLVEGLEQPEGLSVDVTGDTATAHVPGGHEVRLKREGGVWRVEDFD